MNFILKHELMVVQAQIVASARENIIKQDLQKYKFTGNVTKNSKTLNTRFQHYRSMSTFKKIFFRSEGEKYTYNSLLNLFPKEEILVNTKPEWLVNPKTNKKLEFDFYIPSLALVVEYNGSQHYSPYKTQKDEVFDGQLCRDRVKRDLCDNQSIHIISIPSMVRRAYLTKFIYSHLTVQQQKKSVSPIQR